MRAKFSKAKFLTSEKELIADTNDEISLVPFDNDVIPIPNYRDKIPLNVGVNYIVGVTSKLQGYRSGWIYAGTTSRSSDNHGTIEINGLSSDLTGYDSVYESDTACCAIFLPVKYGDSFTINIADGTPRIYFIPVVLG